MIQMIEGSSLEMIVAVFEEKVIQTRIVVAAAAAGFLVVVGCFYFESQIQRQSCYHLNSMIKH